MLIATTNHHSVPHRMLRALTTCLLLTSLIHPDAAARTKPPAAATVEQFQLTTQDDIKLSASFYVPKARSGRSKGVLLVHDAGADSQEYDDLAKYLQRRGFGVLTLDLRGHGKSRTKEMSWSGLGEKEQQRMWSFALRDIKAGVHYLKDRKDIHSSTLSMVGVGSGCTLAVRHSLRDENVAAVVLIGPTAEQYGFDLPGDLSDLEGLPTLILGEKADRPIAVRLQEAGHRNSTGAEYIEVRILKKSKGAVLKNKRLPREASSWLRGQVMPKKS